ncbi:plasmid mobilization protein [Rivularia sp. UHCC 0363]|uniref:plasmid mobilization protein n=1 Tax=Rivularia sp. UHCC 0363 TaxID=3110244 RepID=UPI002B2081EF|nr:hypothetical protein [Rivularia sp. UHCC 0363]MEA5599422.1 hypothetical protein [Rivularia sp. UHCC 0363]
MAAKQKQHTVRFEMLLTPEQNEYWQALAESSGISKAELVRRRMAGCRIKSIPQINWKCYWQLLKISEDISQIAAIQNHAIAQGLTLPPIDFNPFEELLREISTLRLCLVLESEEEISNER